MLFSKQSDLLSGGAIKHLSFVYYIYSTFSLSERSLLVPSVGECRYWSVILWKKHGAEIKYAKKSPCKIQRNCAKAHSQHSPKQNLHTAVLINTQPKTFKYFTLCQHFHLMLLLNKQLLWTLTSLQFSDLTAHVAQQRPHLVNDWLFSLLPGGDEAISTSSPTSH